jgi:hypothetical protein
MKIIRGLEGLRDWSLAAIFAGIRRLFRRHPKTKPVEVAF